MRKQTSKSFGTNRFIRLVEQHEVFHHVCGWYVYKILCEREREREGERTKDLIYLLNNHDEYYHCLHSPLHLK